jgi:O-antigen/teichoic acid export membrane protein
MSDSANHGNSFRKNSFWLLLARITAQVLAILFVAISARNLSLEDFGHFSFIASVLFIGNTFTNFGTDIFLVRDIARAGHITKLASQVLSLQLFLSTCFFAAIYFYHDPPLTLYSLALFPLAIFSIANPLLRALNRMDLSWLLSLLNGVMQVVAAYFSSDVFTICLFLLVGQFILSVLALLICSASLSDFSLLPLVDFRPILKTTFPFAALTLLIVLIQRLGTLSVSFQMEDSATGLFSAAARVVDGLKFGHYAILGALLPALSRNAENSWHSFRKAFLLLTTISLIFAVFLVIFAGPVIAILYGSEFLPAVAELRLFGWCLLPYTFSSFASNSLIARGLERKLVKATLLSAICYLILYLWFIRLYGLTGAVWAALSGECMQAAILALYYFDKKAN